MNIFQKGTFRYQAIMGVTWICLILIFGYFAVKLPDVLKGNGFEFNGEHKQTNQILEDYFKYDQTSILVLFEKEEQVTNAHWYSSIKSFLIETTQLPYLLDQVSPLEHHQMLKGNLAYAVLLFEDLEGKKLIQVIKNLNNLASTQNGGQITITGEPVMVEDLNQASQEDLAKAEMIGLPIALIVLILAFGGLAAASIPLIIGVSSILVSMGIVYFCHHYVHLSIFILNIVPMIGLALSIDFALLFINRYKEELATNSHEDSLSITLRTAGKSIIFSGLCVFIGLSGLLFIQIDIFQNVAIGGMIVVFISIVASLTLLPFILRVLGDKINALPLLRKKKGSQNLWNPLARFVMDHPIRIVILSLTLLFICLIPTKDIQLVIPGVDSIPPNYESRIAYETYKSHFIPVGREEENELLVVLESKGKMASSKNIQLATNYIEELVEDEYVAEVVSPFSLSKVESPERFIQMWNNNQEFSRNLSGYIQENKMLLKIYLTPERTQQEVHEWIDQLHKKGTQFKINLGGHVKFEEEIFNEIKQKAPFGLLLITVSTFIILAAAFRSLLIPLKAIFMNILSLGATFGIVVWIFQYGHFNIEPVSIGLILPVFVFSIVFGLSMDYEVFLISRIHEVYLETNDNREATVTGLTSTSKIITSAAAIMIVITGAFSFTGVMPIKQIGIGISIAILIDATIIRLLLVPALMKLLGDWNWWFFGLKRSKANH
jgi:putative drug exporter of the RND superfamily